MSRPQSSKYGGNGSDGGGNRANEIRAKISNRSKAAAHDFASYGGNYSNVHWNSVWSERIEKECKIDLNAKAKWKNLYSDTESVSSNSSTHFQVEELDKKGSRPTSSSGFRPSHIRTMVKKQQQQSFSDKDSHPKQPFGSITNSTIHESNINNYCHFSVKRNSSINLMTKTVDLKTKSSNTLNRLRNSALPPDQRDYLIKLLDQKNSKIIEKYTTRPMSSSTRVMNFPSSDYYNKLSSQEYQKIVGIVNNLETQKAESNNEPPKPLSQYSSKDAIDAVETSLTEKEDDNEGENDSNGSEVSIEVLNMPDDKIATCSSESNSKPASRPSSAAFKSIKYTDPSVTWTSETREAYKDPAETVKFEQEIMEMKDEDGPDEIIFIPKSSFFHKSRGNNWVHTNPNKKALSIYNLSFKTTNSEYGAGKKNYGSRINQLERMFWQR